MDPSARRMFMLRRLAEQGLTFAELMNLTQVCDRTLRTDLQVLTSAHPKQLQKQRQGRAIRYRFLGVPPEPIRSLNAFDEDQITALIAARGMLRAPPHRAMAAEQRASWSNRPKPSFFTPLDRHYGNLYRLQHRRTPPAQPYRIPDGGRRTPSPTRRTTHDHR